ncbi:MAG: type II secretion system F family protein [Candidatus Baltobacteraceae bacterium]
MSDAFLYLARRSDGSRSSGVLSADSWHTAATELVERGLTVVFLDRQQSVHALFRPSDRFRSTPEKARRSFYRALGTLLTAGCSFSRSLHLCIARSDSPALRDALMGTLARVESGRSLSEALAGMPREFPPNDVALIRAGEQMGSLDGALVRLANRMEKTSELRGRISGAIAYPAWVFIASIAIMAGLAVTTLPSIVSLLNELGAKPSGLLALSIAMAGALSQPGGRLALVGGILALATAGSMLHAWPALRAARERAFLRVPLLGKIIADRCAGDFFSVVSELLSAGVGIVESIALAANAADNQVLKRSAKLWIAKIESGETWSSCMEDSPLIDAMTKTMIELGEETGSLPTLLGAIGAHRLSEAETRLRFVTSFLEPLAMIAIGGMVALFVSGVLIPIYNAIGGIR